jgi:RNA polymerase sigma-70 factor (ECF subfamily)
VLLQCRGAWPEVTLEDDAFVQALVRAADETPPREALEQVNAPHLYLATACAQGSAAAIASFEQLCGGSIDAALSRFAGRGTMREDIKQTLREHLLVGTPDRPPKIGDYRGRGSLTRWVRVAAVRLAIDSVRGRGRLEDPSSDDALLEGIGTRDSPEMSFLREKYQGDFKVAFEQSVAELDPAERRLLREHVVFGLSTARVAALHDISKSTAARRIAAARERLIEGVYRCLRESLGVSSSELQSVMRLAASELHVSLSRIFRSGGS